MGMIWKLSKCDEMGKMSESNNADGKRETSMMMRKKKTSMKDLRFDLLM
jgi:hypothetical protein